MHPTKQSVHYQGLGWAKKGNQTAQPNTNPKVNPNQPKQYPSTYSGQNQNALMQQNNSPFPTNNNNANNRQRNYTTQNNYGPNQIQQMQKMQQQNGGSMRRLNNNMNANVNPAMTPQQQQQLRMQQQMAQMRGGMGGSMTAAQMRNSMNPSMQQQAQMRMAVNMQNRNNNNNNMQNQQIRKSMPPQQMQQMQRQQQQQQQQQQKGMQQKKQALQIQPKKHRKDKTKIFGHDPSVPAPPGANNTNNNTNNTNNNNEAKSGKSVDDDNEDIYGKYSKSGPNLHPNQRPMAGNTLQAKRAGHFQSNSASNVGQKQNVHFKNTKSTGQLKMQAKHRKDKTKIFGQDPSVPAPPGANNNSKHLNCKQQTNNRVSIAKNANVKPNQLTAQQRQQMNTMQKQNQMYRQQQVMRQQNQSVRNVHGHQRQVKRNFAGGAWGPSHPYYRQWQMQQRQMQMQRQQSQQYASNNPKSNQHYRQWQQYYQRLMQNPQGQLQQMIMQQQQMIGNLKRQLQERDKHYHKTIQTTINFKDMEINELRGQMAKLDEENETIGELQMQNFQMKKELNALRGDHQANVFDNLFAGMTASSVGKNKVQWPGGKAPNSPGTKPNSPPKSDTIAAGAHDPKAAINAMLKAKASPSEMLLSKKGEEEKKRDRKDDGKYAKYAKMKKIGMPMVSIVNKMRMDGLSAQEIEEYTGEKVGGSSSDSKPKTGPIVNLLDPKFDKYKRMQKLRMPIKSILNKMKLDGFNQYEIDAFSGKKSSGQSAADKKKARLDELRQLAETMGLIAINEVLPSKVAKMKRIHWEIIELSAIRKTFWYNINQDKLIAEHINLGGKFELDFQVRARKPRFNTGKGKIVGGLDAITGNKEKKKGKGDIIRWVSAKRDQSIQIALKRVGLPNEVIYDAIVDVNEEVMGLDLLEVIWEIVPDSDEQALAEAKVDEIGDNMDSVGISEMFHIEMSTIPEVKQQLSKWLFARTFREIYMDRLAQVNVMQKCANAIKQSIALQTYFRIILSMGNLMNHGTVKGMAYGFKLDSVNKLLRGIKDYGGKKDLGMFLYQFAYNQFPESRSIFEELSEQLKKAIRLEVTTIESSIVKMADEFTAIDLFMRRLHDDFHPGDTERFRAYMNDFQERQSTDMMNLKVKIQNASSICKQVAKFYSIQLQDGKPEHLFIVIQQFIKLLAGAKRSLLKLEKERVKAQQKAAKEAAKRRKQTINNNNNNKSKMSISDRIINKKKKAIEDEEKGNLLFLDIKNAANDFAKRQEQMAMKLESTLKEKKQLAKGKVSQSAQKDAIKRRVSAQVVDGNDNSVGGLDMQEIKRLRAMPINLGVPGMEMEITTPPDINDNNQDNNENNSNVMDENDYGSLQTPQMQINIVDENHINQLQEFQEEEDMNQDIDVQEQPENNNNDNNNNDNNDNNNNDNNNVDLTNAQWDDDDF